MNDTSEWMPVFILVERRQTVHAAHPDHKVPLPQGRAEDVLQRIGTAWREKDGSYLIQLTALPMHGDLLMRPPRSGECPTSTFKEER